MKSIAQRSVCICGSFRYSGQIEGVARELRAVGIECSTPTPNADPASGVRSCFRRIDEAEAILVVDPDGYIGASVFLDIGYAYTKGRPIYLTSPHEDPGLMGLVSGVVGEDREAGRATGARSSCVVHSQRSQRYTPQGNQEEE